MFKMGQEDAILRSYVNVPAESIRWKHISEIVCKVVNRLLLSLQ